jgi:Na+/proline symporter
VNLDKIQTEPPKCTAESLGFRLLRGAVVALFMASVGLLLSLQYLRTVTLSWGIFCGAIGGLVGLVVSGKVTWREAFNRGVLPGLLCGAILWPAGVAGRWLLFGQLDRPFTTLADAAVTTGWAGGILGTPLGGIAGVVSKVMYSGTKPAADGKR